MPLLASVTNSVVEVWELSDPSGHDSNPNLSRKGNKFTNKKTGVKHKNIKGLLPSAVSAPFGSIKSFFKLDKTGKTAGPSTNLSGPAKSPKPSRLQSIKRTMRSETPPQKHTKLVKKRSPSQNERYSPQRQGQVQGQYHGLELVGHGPEYSNQNQNPNEYLPAPGGVGIGLGLEPEERKVSDTTESTNKSNTDSSIKNSIIFEPFFYLNHNNYCDLITSITWSLKDPRLVISSNSGLLKFYNSTGEIDDIVYKYKDKNIIKKVINDNYYKSGFLVACENENENFVTRYDETKNDYEKPLFRCINKISSLVCDTTGDIIVAGGEHKGELVYYKRNMNKKLELNSHTKQRIGQVAISPLHSTPLLIAGSDDGMLQFYDSYQARLQPIRVEPQLHNAPITGVVFNKQQPRVVFSVGMDGLITLLDTAIKKHSIVYPAFESNSNIGGRSPGNPKLNINTPFTCVDISPNGYSLFTGDVYGKVMELDLRYLSLSLSKTQLYSGKRSACVWQRYSGMGGSVKHLSYCESLNFPPSYSPVAFRSAVTNTENTNSHTYLSAKQPIVSFDPLSNTNLQHPNLDSNPDIIHDTNPSNLSIDQSYHSFNPASRSANFSNIADNSIYNTYSSSIANATINQFTRVSNIRRGIPQSMTDSSDEDNRPLVAPDDPSLISHLPADEPFDSKTSVVDSSNTNLSNRGDTQIVGVVSTIPDSSQDQTQTQTETETQIETTHNPLMDVLTPQKSTSPSTHTFKSTKSHSSEVSISGTHRSINCPDMSVDLAPDNSDRVNIKSSNKRSISKLLSSSPPSIPKVTEKSERADSKSQLNIDIPNSSLNPISIPISTSTLHKKPLSPNVKEKVEYFQKKAKAESKLNSNSKSKSNSPINIDPFFSSYSIPTSIPNPADKDSFQTATPGNTQYHTTPSRRSRKSSEKFLSLKNSFEPKTVSPSNVETNTESPSLTPTKNTNNSPPSASPSTPPSPSPLKHSNVARASNFISWRSSNTSYTPFSPPHHSLGSAKSNSIISETSAGLAASHDKRLDKNAATFSFINPSSSQNASSSINTKDKYATSTKSRRDVRNLSATDTANEDSSHDSTTASHLIGKSANGRLKYSASSSKLLNSLISDTLADNFNQINSNINNMHLDMIRQSFVTESKIDKLTESVSDNQQKLSELTRYINDYLVPDSENPKGAKNINNSNNSTVSHGANVFNKSGHNKNGYANGSLYYAS